MQSFVNAFTPSRQLVFIFKQAEKDITLMSNHNNNNNQGWEIHALCIFYSKANLSCYRKSVT